MANIQEHESKMTIFYYKSNGDIHSYCTGISDMKIFGDHTDDYSRIIDYVVVERDRNVIELLYRFYVDLDTKKIKLKPEYDFGRYL